MSIKQILILILIIVAVGSIPAFFILKPGSVSPSAEPLSSSPTAIPTPQSLLTWTDEAGFSFQYPEGTTIDKHPEDTQNYANLTLTMPSSQVINIIMSDITVKDIVANATLGGKPASQTTKSGQTTLISIDNDVMVTITGNDISTIVNSWQFVYPTPTVSKTTKTVAPAPASDGGDVLEEE